MFKLILYSIYAVTSKETGMNFVFSIPVCEPALIDEIVLKHGLTPAQKVQFIDATCALLLASEGHMDSVIEGDPLCQAVVEALDEWVELTFSG